MQRNIARLFALLSPSIVFLATPFPLASRSPLARVQGKRIFNIYFRFLIVPLVFLLVPSCTRAEDIVYPSDSGVINVKTAYGAKGDSITNDTVAIQNAISQNINRGDDRTLYFPNGTYKISNSLYWKDASGTWGNRVSFQGESQANTIIKLVDGASGFGSSGSPKAAIYTASVNASSDGSGEEAYGNNISNLTIDTGHNNPGAVGLNYQASNQGALKGVTIQSDDGKGVAGLNLGANLFLPGQNGSFGPALIKNVTINGFDTGILVGRYIVSATFYNITLNHQKVVGFYSQGGNAVAIQGLTSVNSVSAIKEDYDRFLLTLTGGNFTGGSSAQSAIVLTNGARAFVRNVRTSGYQSAISNSGTVVAGSNVTEWVSNPTRSLFSRPMTSLNLPIQDTPATYEDSNLTNWANIQSYGTCKGVGYCDATSEFQAAIDSGKPIVYIPHGYYSLSQPIHVRGNVQRVVQFGGSIIPACGFPVGGSAFIVDNNTPSVVTLDHIDLLYNYSGGSCPSNPYRFTWAVTDASSQTLVIKNSIAIDYTTQAGGAGPVFLEDVAGTTYNFDHQTAWVRQLDPETPATGSSNPVPSAEVTNNGGKVWILGLKTEEDLGDTTVIKTIGGGQTEMLGAVVYHANYSYTVPASTPAFISIDSSQSLSYDMGYSDWEVNVQETWSGVTRNLYRYCSSTGSPQSYPQTGGFAPQCDDKSVVPLFTGRYRRN